MYASFVFKPDMDPSLGCIVMPECELASEDLLCTLAQHATGNDLSLLTMIQLVVYIGEMTKKSAGGQSTQEFMISRHETQAFSRNLSADNPGRKRRPLPDTVPVIGNLNGALKIFLGKWLQRLDIIHDRINEYPQLINIVEDSTLAAFIAHGTEIEFQAVPGHLREFPGEGSIWEHAEEYHCTPTSAGVRIYVLGFPIGWPFYRYGNDHIEKKLAEELGQFRSRIGKRNRRRTRGQ